MNDDTATDGGPVSTQPTGNPDLGMPGDSPLATAPEPEAPALEPDSTEPAVDTADGAGVSSEEAGPAGNDLVLEGATALPEAAAEPLPEPRRLSRGEREVYDRTRQRFAACGRCGYLFADCLLLLGEEAVQDAAIRARDGWLRLEGDEGLRPLLSGAFGVRLDLGYDYMDGACPECRRRFVFAALEDGQVRVKLRT